METIVDTLTTFFLPACAFGVAAIVFSGIRMFSDDRSQVDGLLGFLANACVVICFALVVACLVLLLNQARDQLPASIEEPTLSPANCEAIVLDGTEEQLLARLECEGIEVTGPCELSAADREAFKRMDVDFPECSL